MWNIHSNDSLAWFSIWMTLQSIELYTCFEFGLYKVIGWFNLKEFLWAKTNDVTEAFSQFIYLYTIFKLSYFNFVQKILCKTHFSGQYFPNLWPEKHVCDTTVISLWLLVLNIDHQTSLWIIFWLKEQWIDECFRTFCPRMSLIFELVLINREFDKRGTFQKETWTMLTN